MPSLVIPRRTSAHRYAAISLYRALLSQCRLTPLSSQQKDELQNVVRNRFKAAIHETSLRWLRLAFRGAYEAVDKLDACVAGDEDSKEYLIALLERIDLKTKQPPVPLLTNSKKARKAQTEVDESKIVKRSIFDRPRPLSELSGKRHIPKLVSANLIPFLRIKKPQPASLTMYLTSHINRRQTIYDRRHRLALEKQTAEQEDSWDALIAGQLPASEVDEPTWTSAINAADRDIDVWINRDKRKMTVTARKMQRVIDEERAMLKQEREDRRAIKRAAYEENVKKGEQNQE